MKVVVVLTLFIAMAVAAPTGKHAELNALLTKTVDSDTDVKRDKRQFGFGFNNSGSRSFSIETPFGSFEASDSYSNEHGFGGPYYGRPHHGRPHHHGGYGHGGGFGGGYGGGFLFGKK